jgi:hypothetical protein
MRRSSISSVGYLDADKDGDNDEDNDPLYTGRSSSELQRVVASSSVSSLDKVGCVLILVDTTSTNLHLLAVLLSFASNVCGIRFVVEESSCGIAMVTLEEFASV